MTLQHQAEAEAGPVVVENGRGAGDLVIVCEHASNAIPARYAGLGLTGEALDSHIAWDPGALAVARQLAERFDAPLVRATISRLIIDCNRQLDAPDLIVSEADSIAIPENRIDDEERDRRFATVHEPFHAALGRLVADRLATDQLRALVSIHSFTPVLHGQARPWDVGIIFGSDRRLANPLISGLREDGSLVVGVNEPYSPADRVFYTHERHAEPLNLPSVMIEIRNDLIADSASQQMMAERLAGAMREATAELADTVENGSLALVGEVTLNGKPMPKAIRSYVRVIDAVNLRIGRFAMYLIFAMMGILLYSSISKTFFHPSLWTLEMAQFTMVAYYLLGGSYSMQLGSHVRMDLLYGRWSDKTRAMADATTVLFLIFYLGVLLYGGFSSTHYALQYGETSYSSWSPYMAPIKIIMTLGIFLMLLQALATLFKDLAKLRGEDLS